MKTLLRCLPFGLLLVSVAVAHPGHEGHELIWEYRGSHVHIDWIVCLTVVALGTWAISRYVRSQR